MSASPEQNQTITPDNDITMAVDTASSDNTSPGSDDATAQRKR